MDELVELISELSRCRYQLQAEQDEWDRLQDDIKRQFGKRMEVLAGQLAKARDAVSTVEDTVRTTAVEQYRQDGNKHPHPAVTVKVFSVLEYNQDAALKFAVESMPDALKLNASVFEKNAKVLVGMNVNGVSNRLREMVIVKDDPRPYISKDLGGY